jgi:hypothetical protein
MKPGTSSRGSLFGLGAVSSVLAACAEPATKQPPMSAADEKKGDGSKIPAAQGAPAVRFGCGDGLLPGSALPDRTVPAKLEGSRGIE